MRAYSSYFSLEQALLKTKITYYQNASYSIVEPNGDYQYIKLCVGEAVETTMSTDGLPAFGIIKGIIEHTWNDGQVYVFIYLDWLEDLNKHDNLLGCPIYRLKHACNNSWDRLHSISIVSKSPNVPFIHYCKAGCSSQQHDTTNRKYTVFEMIFSLQQFKDFKCRNYVTVEFISILIVINVRISATSITIKIM